VLFNAFPLHRPTPDQLTLLLQSKKHFILNQWLLDYPDSSITTFSGLSDLVSSSGIVQKWYSVTKAEYARLLSMPSWVLADAEAREAWQKDFVDVGMTLAKKLKTLNAEKLAASERYKTELSVLDEKIEFEITSRVRNNVLLAIDMITVQALPLDITESAMVNADAEVRRGALKQSLARYKLELYKSVTSGQITLEELLKLLHNK
jgi:hypothetical protein